MDFSRGPSKGSGKSRSLIVTKSCPRRSAASTALSSSASSAAFSSTSQSLRWAFAGPYQAAASSNSGRAAVGTGDRVAVIAVLREVWVLGGCRREPQCASSARRIDRSKIGARGCCCHTSVSE